MMDRVSPLLPAEIEEARGIRGLWYAGVMFYCRPKSTISSIGGSQRSARQVALLADSLERAVSLVSISRRSAVAPNVDHR